MNSNTQSPPFYQGDLHIRLKNQNNKSKCVMLTGTNLTQKNEEEQKKKYRQKFTKHTDKNRW